MDKHLRVWDLRQAASVKFFNGHRDEITVRSYGLNQAPREYISREGRSLSSDRPC